MKIAIDGSGAMGAQSGVGKYIYKLIDNLRVVDNNNDYLVYLNYLRTNKKNPFLDNSLISVVKNRVPAKVQRFLQNHFKLPIETFTGKIDIFHGPNYFIPPSRNAKRIVSVHDLTFVNYPKTMIGNDASYYQKYVPQSIKQADHIITISNSTKRELIEKLAVPKEKITVTYMAAGEEFKPLKNEQTRNIIKKYNLPDKFMLTVSTLEPRKNLITLVKSLAILKKDNKLEQKLVVVGSSGWKNEKLFVEIQKNKLEQDIIFTGYVQQKDLPYFYNACSIFIFPSLYEGFGIPPLEALSCGTPCICSNSSSLPEVVGEAAILVNPLDIQEFSKQIVNILNNPLLAKSLGQKGLKQAEKFNWQKTAKETFDVYRGVFLS